VAAGPVSGVDAGDAQQADGDAEISTEGAQPPLGVNPAPRPVGGRRHRPGLVEHRTAGITVHAGGTAVDDALDAPATGQRLQQMGGAPVLRALAGRWGQVQHGVGQAADARQRRRIVQVTQQWHRAGLAQHRGTRG